MNPFHPDGQELKEELTLLQTQVEALQQLIGELILKNQQLREALRSSAKKTALRPESGPFKPFLA